MNIITPYPELTDTLFKIRTDFGAKLIVSGFAIIQVIFPVCLLTLLGVLALAFIEPVFTEVSFVFNHSHLLQITLHDLCFIWLGLFVLLLSSLFLAVKFIIVGLLI